MPKSRKSIKQFLTERQSRFDDKPNTVCKIADIVMESISPIDPQTGEQTAHGGENAWLRQSCREPVELRVVASQSEI